MPRRNSEYPTLSELVKRSNRNIFATAELQSDSNKNAAIHYSYNLTRNETDGNGAAEHHSKGRGYSEARSGRKLSQSISADRRWRYSRSNVKVNRQEDANENLAVAGSVAEGLDLNHRMWSSALSRDSKFYCPRQHSEPLGYRGLVRIPREETLTRHNSLPGGRLPLHRERGSSSDSRDVEKAKRRKWGICDDTDGSHYQRQFLRVLKKRF